MDSIHEGTLWRALKASEEDVQRYFDTEAAAPSTLFSFVTRLAKGDTGTKEFEGKLACSVDWKEHPACGTAEQALDRKVAQGRSDNTIWEIRSTEATKECHLPRLGVTVSLSLEHWPESANEAHANLVMASGFDAVPYKTERRAHIRDQLCLAARLTFWRRA